VIQVVDAGLTRITDAICSSLQISHDAVSIEKNDHYRHKLKLKIVVGVMVGIDGGTSLTNVRQNLEKALSIIGISITQASFTTQEYIFDLVVTG